METTTGEFALEDGEILQKFYNLGVDVEAVLGDLCYSGELRGNEYVASCPMPGHTDSRPSFAYNVLRDVYNCKGCHIAGHGIRQLVQDVLGVNPLAAGKYLAAYRHGSLADKALYRVAAERREKANRQQAAQELALAKRLWTGAYEEEYQGLVTTTWEEPHTEAQEYMLDLRGFTPATMEYFHVHTWEFDKKGNPIFIPLTWQRDVWGYTRRAIYDRRDKYLTMPGAEVSKYLFGEAVAGQPFLLMEGPTDAMKAWQRGIRSYGACLSSSLSQEQAALIRKYAKVVICASDMDAGGDMLYRKVQERITDIPIVRMWLSQKDVDAVSNQEFMLACQVVMEEVRNILKKQ